MIKSTLPIAVIILLSSAVTQAQVPGTDGSDTSYYKSYTDKLTTRFYFSQKYTSFTLSGNDSLKDLQYRPNTTRNMGIGVTYGWLTLNLALAFPFLNQGEDEKGKTKYLDLQSHSYSRKYSVDLLGEFYKGYYLFPKGRASENPDTWYQRPDMRVTHIGTVVYRVLNWRRFSFRAAMLQNEWQKKSAGSILAGIEAYYGKIKGDSSLVPQLLEASYDQQNISAVRYINAGPGLGYAYTLVIKSHFFLTGAATASLTVNGVREWKEEEKTNKISIGSNLSYRAAAGYNSERWSASLLWVNNGLATRGASGNYQTNTGNIRLTTAYRINPGKKLKKSIRMLGII